MFISQGWRAAERRSMAQGSIVDKAGALGFVARALCRRVRSRAVSAAEPHGDADHFAVY